MINISNTQSILRYLALDTLHELNYLLQVIYLKCIKYKVLDAQDFHKYRRLDNDINRLAVKIDKFPHLSIWETIPVDDLSPYVRAFFKAMFTTISHLGGEIKNMSGIAVSRRVFEFLIFNYRTLNFQNEIANLARVQKYNEKSLINYVTNLKRAYRRLMVVRVDLYCKKDFVSLNQISSYWQQLLREVMRDYANSFAGYAVKFEYGVDRGVHLHVMFFFDGDEVRQDATIAKSIGIRWNSIVPNDIGSFFNGNTDIHKQRMRHCAVGIIEDGNDEFFRGIKAIAKYVTKTDSLVRLAVPDICHVLRCGRLTQKQKDMIVKRSKRQCNQNNPLFFDLRSPYVGQISSV